VCLPDSETVPERVDSEARLRLDRRSAILGAGCVALATVMPGGALAARSAGRRVRAAAATLPMQSPIDFREGDITFVNRLPRVRFAYPQAVGVTLVNTGSPDEFATVRAEPPAGAAHITLSGVRWDLEQFHWHTPSEHEIEGRDTPLEMHFVHVPADPEGSAAPFLVLAVFIEEGRKNPAIEPMFRRLPGPGETREVPTVTLRKLLPDERESFHYSGSLTTPPFTEPVLFVVFADSIAGSRGQIGAFQALFPDGNSREVQPLNGREVRSDAEEVFH
jgi:carbonic anhydrase